VQTGKIGKEIRRQVKNMHKRLWIAEVSKKNEADAAERKNIGHDL
jgi:hypothetical protein